MNGIFKAGLLALALAGAGAARAGDSEDFAGCDWLKKPKSKDDGMRGQASVPGYSFGFAQGQGKGPALIVAACDRALTGGKLRPEQTLRRAHLLRARAAARLELGQHEQALADIDAAIAAAAEYRGDFFYRRSMGLSLDLLRAIALTQTGGEAEALRLAEAAAAERPYAIQIQTVATVIRDVHSTPGADTTGLWDPLVRLDPNTRELAIPRAIEAGKFDSVIALAGEEGAAGAEIPEFNTLMGGNPMQALGAWAGGIATAMQVAYAHAALGQEEIARANVAAVRARLEEARAQSADSKTIGGRLIDFVTTGTVEPYEALVEARIAVAEGRPDEARTLIEGKKLPKNGVTEELMRALVVAAPIASGALAQPDTPAPLPPERASKLGQLAGMLLIHPESQRTLIDYKKSRPDILGALVGGALSMGTSLLGGIERTAGFRSTPNADGSVKVEYTGNTTSGPVVQEMTLLRAAELAREGGHAGFVIADRKDFQRYMAVTQYGIEQSRTLTGYKTELTVRYLAEGEAHPAAFDTVAVIDALGPVYYEESGSASGRRQAD